MINPPLSLSVLIPTYNEAATIGTLLTQISKMRARFLELQVIVIDDGSTDDTHKIVKRFGWVEYLRHDTNQGKTAALKTGLRRAKRNYVLTQDADLEYSPFEWQRLLKAVTKTDSKVVYGSRRLGNQPIRTAAAWFYLGGMAINYFTNWLYQAHLTDVPTGYKLFERKLLLSLPITTKRFEFCPEVTARLLKQGIKITEVPISYHPRSVREGKKISWHDFGSAVWVLVAVKFGWI